MEFLHWISLYNGVLANLYGKERRHVLSILENDEKFDRWLEDHEKKLEDLDNRPNMPGGGGQTITKDNVFRNIPGTVFTGDDEE